MPGTREVVTSLFEHFPQAKISRVPLQGFGGVLLTPNGKALRPDRITRLLLPELLPDVERLLLLPLPAVATADIARLAEIDLGEHAIAAAIRPGALDASGFRVIHSAAARLTGRPAAAAELRRTAHARHAFDFEAFTHDVLVLDLARLRRDGFTGQALPLIEAFGLDDLEALHYLIGGDRAVVPEEWAFAPTRSLPRGPGLIYWPDKVKPWQRELTPARDRWRRQAAALASDGGEGSRLVGSREG
jgi:hypothetical protein